MIGTTTFYALRHRAIVLALLVLFTIAGVISFRELPVEAYPDVTNVSFQIITLFPGHAAEEVERLVTIPIENVMNGIPHRTSIRSVSEFGLSQITLTFEDGTDDEFVRNQAAQFLTQVSLPSGAQASLSPDATPVGEIYRYTLEAPKGFPKAELKALEDWVVERQFRTVPGVVDVNGFGGPTKQYQVLIDPAKLRSYGITLSQIFTALANGNQNAGGSYIEHGSELYIVRGLGFIQNLDDIRNIAVDTRNGTPIKISDLGTVQIGEQLRLGRVGKLVPGGADEDDAVEGIVILRRGENALEVLKRVRAKVADINEHYLPAGVKLVTYYDRTDLIERTLHTVRHNMMEGISLVLLVLILFLGLGNYRSALVVAAVVPLSLLGAFLLLDLRGIPANLISLGAIDFGIIVDSAVIIIEDVLHKLEQDRERIHRLRETIVDAVKQMGRPILFSKAILLTAFIPLYTLQRVEGKIFKPMALTLTFALVVGTILALTVVPVLASFAFRKNISTRESWIVHQLHRVYHPWLNRALQSRALFLGGATVLLVLAGVVLTRIGSEFLPKLDEGTLWVRAFMPETISPSQAGRLAQDIRRILVSFPEVQFVVSQLGATRRRHGHQRIRHSGMQRGLESKPCPMENRPDSRRARQGVESKTFANSRRPISVQPIHRGQRQRSRFRREERIEHKNLRRRTEPIAGAVGSNGGPPQKNSRRGGCQRGRVARPAAGANHGGSRRHRALRPCRGGRTTGDRHRSRRRNGHASARRRTHL